MNKIITGCCLLLLCTVSFKLSAQIIEKGYFRLLSTSNSNDSTYGLISFAAGKHTVVIQSIMANGENVTGLNIAINKGLPFKLAPSQKGSILHYVGTKLGLVLKPGDEVIISFDQSGPRSVGNRQLYLSGEAFD